MQAKWEVTLGIESNNQLLQGEDECDEEDLNNMAIAAAKSSGVDRKRMACEGGTESRLDFPFNYLAPESVLPGQEKLGQSSPLHDVQNLLAELPD
jgi:hypothetical protein